MPPSVNSWMIFILVLLAIVALLVFILLKVDISLK